MEAFQCFPPKVASPPVPPIADTLKLAAALVRDDAIWLTAVVLHVEIERHGKYSFWFGNDVAKLLGLSARAKRQGLAELEAARLVEVVRRDGQSPYVVTVHVKWFEQLPDFLGVVAISRAAGNAKVLLESDAQGSGDSATGDRSTDSGNEPVPFPPASFQKTTLRAVLEMYRPRRNSGDLAPHFVTQHIPAWHEMSNRLTEIAGHRSVFRLTAAQVEEALDRVAKSSDELWFEPAAACETASALGWILRNGFMTEPQAYEIIAVLQRRVTDTEDKLERPSWIVKKAYPMLVFEGPDYPEWATDAPPDNWTFPELGAVP